ncbi:MAG: GAF and ANTAR domain-containing protein [Propionibacteriaceae bacterium]
MLNALDLAQVMDHVAKRLNEPVPLEQVLSRIVGSAINTIPGLDYAGVSVWRPNGQIDTLAHTHEIVLELDRLQYSLREGPCVDAMRGELETWVSDLSVETRWPQYGPQAVELGVVSHIGLQLFTEDNKVGGLNLYASRAHAFQQDTLAIARLFATQAAHAMGKAMKEEQLTESIATRTIIGQAMGIVMERYTLDDDRAFSFLKRTSQDGNIKLVEVARHIVNEANRTAGRIES